MGKRIFKDEEHQKLFDKQGFIVLPFLLPHEIVQLDSTFDELHPDISQSGFYSGSYSLDFDYKKKASDAIVNTFRRAYAELFVNYTPFGGAFLYKVPGVNSALAAHQDWTILDEKENVALNCWVPLCDVTLENGPIMIMPGSQFDKLNVIRAPTLPFFFSGDDDMVVNELEVMEVKAGTAVILNQSVIHYSPPNNSNKIRKAITAGIKSEGAQMYFHYKVPEKDELEIFTVPDDFFLRFKNFIEDMHKRPYWGKSVGVITYKLPQYRGTALQEKLTQMKTDAGFFSNPIIKTREEVKFNQKSFSQRLFFMFQKLK